MIILCCAMLATASATPLVSRINVLHGNDFVDGEPVIVEFSLYNPTEQPHTILAWSTPLEDAVRSPLFDIIGANVTFECQCACRPRF